MLPQRWIVISHHSSLSLLLEAPLRVLTSKIQTRANGACIQVDAFKILFINHQVECRWNSKFKGPEILAEWLPQIFSLQCHFNSCLEKTELVSGVVTLTFK